MGSLRRLPNGKPVILTGNVMLGRAPGCDIVVTDAWVSSRHAALEWRNDEWVLRDLGSRNGTWTGTRRLPSGASVTLKAGDRFGLGSVDASWELVAASPPVASARNLQTGAQFYAQDGTISVPASDGSTVTLLEDAEENAWVRDGHRVNPSFPLLAGEWRYALSLPGVVDETIAQARLMLPKAHLTFFVSGDMEHVSLEVRDGEERAKLPARAPFWPVYVLAEERIREGDATDDAGWLSLDELGKRCGMDRRALDIYFGRVRAALSREAVGGSDVIVEARPGARRIGIPAARLSVVRGGR